MKVLVCLLVLAVACSAVEEKKTEKRGVLGLGYGGGYYGGLGHSLPLAHAGLGYGGYAGYGGYGGYGLGYPGYSGLYGHAGYLGHGGYSAPLITKSIGYPAPLLGLGHGYPYLH